MERLANEVANAAFGTDTERSQVQARVARAHWGIEDGEKVDPVIQMVDSMMTTARRGKEDRFQVASIARAFGINIAAQLGQESFEKAVKDYGSNRSDTQVIRRFGSLVKWALAKEGPVSMIASITIDSVNVQLEGIRRGKIASGK